MIRRGAVERDFPKDGELRAIAAYAEQFLAARVSLRRARAAQDVAAEELEAKRARTLVLEALGEVAELIEELSSWQLALVAAAREEEISWRVVGDFSRVTPQAAQQRWGHRLHDAMRLDERRILSIRSAWARKNNREHAAKLMAKWTPEDQPTS